MIFIKSINLFEKKISKYNSLNKNLYVFILIFNKILYFYYESQLILLLFLCVYSYLKNKCEK